VRGKRNNNSIVDWRELRARKAHLDLRNEDLIRQTGCGSRTVSAFLAGDERLNLDTIIRLAAALGLRPRLTFEPVTESEKVVELKAA
jgi:hypothetical protein